MSEADRRKWDARYAGQDATEGFRPSEVLELALGRLRHERSKPMQLRALDLACGGGRNSIWLAEQGFAVDALDVSGEGLALGQRRVASRQNREQSGQIRWIQADLDAGLPVSGPYDLIAMIRYLDLSLLSVAIELLRPGGVLVVELHMASGEAAVAGPRNPDFLVAPGALAEITAGLEPWLSTEGIVESDGGRKEALARYVGSAGDVL